MNTYSAEIFQEMIEEASRNRSSDLEACIKWLKDNNLETCRNVGPYQMDSYTKGEQVKVRKGSVIFSTGPTFPQEGKILSRAQTVRVYRVMKGFVDYQHSSRNPTVRNPVVYWAGSGSYWRWTDINNVEKA